MDEASEMWGFLVNSQPSLFQTAEHLECITLLSVPQGDHAAAPKFHMLVKTKASSQIVLEVTIKKTDQYICIHVIYML